MGVLASSITILTDGFEIATRLSRELDEVLPIGREVLHLAAISAAAASGSWVLWVILTNLCGITVSTSGQQASHDRESFGRLMRPIEVSTEMMKKYRDFGDRTQRVELNQLLDALKNDLANVGVESPPLPLEIIDYPGYSSSHSNIDNWSNFLIEIRAACRFKNLQHAQSLVGDDGNMLDKTRRYD